MTLNINSDILRELLPKRPDDIHKGSRGRVLVVGGSEHYPGAPALSALGALRSGAGVVTLISIPLVCAACAAWLPEAVYRPIDDRTRWLDAAMSEADSCSAAVIGPGLDRSDEAQSFVAKMWKLWPKALLVDGDGLFALASQSGKTALISRDNAIITPHEGEAARLLGSGRGPSEIRSGRMAAAAALAERWGCVLLKGHETLVARRHDNEVSRLTFGGPELAIPGSGDVLSGCIGALLAAGLSAKNAGILGGALHGMSGSRIREEHGVDGALASEVADGIRWAMNRLRDGDL